MAEKRDYYEVLGIDKSADEKEIKKAYRKLARQYHPDVSDDPKSTEKFKEISEAYAVLSDSDKKQRYDKFGHAGMDGFSQEDIFRNANFEDIFQGFGGGGFNVEDIFDMFGFGGGRSSRRSGPKKGRDLRTELSITLEEAASGIEKEINIKHEVYCPHCNGEKAEPGTNTKTCEVCGGTGEVKQINKTILGQMVNIQPCRECNGTGKIISEHCHECHGKGTVRQNNKLSVKIPAGVETGNRLRFPGEGDAGDVGGGYGDLYVIIKVKNNKNFERDGANLYYEKQISFVEASLGASVDVPTIDGSIELNIPEGTQSGTVFRVRDQGMTRMNRNSKGNLFVTVTVVVPQKLNESQKELLKEFAKISGEEISTYKKGIFDKVKDAINM